MARFSERMGVAPRLFQKESMNDALRNGVWSVTFLRFWCDWNAEGRDLLRALWIFHFHQRADECSSAPNYAVESVKKLYLAQSWAGVYDFLEFVVGHNSAPHVVRMYTEECNHVLRNHGAAYRLIGGEVTPITSDEEIASVEESLRLSGMFAASAEHFRTALARFSDRDSPDYRNSIKESISAVESVCQVITGDPKATLGDSLKRLGIHKALKNGFGSIYGYTNDADGIRHALFDESGVGADDAKFFLVSCSAFVNYLVSRSAAQAES